MTRLLELGASWVWCARSEDVVNQYVQFRHEFTLNDTLSAYARLLISVDTEYAVWLNGKFVDSGQYCDYPGKKTFDELDVTEMLIEGKNVLCILGYYQNESSSRYIKDKPGLIYCLDASNTSILSGEGTYCRQDPCYASGAVPWITRQLGFTFEYNAGMTDEWLFPSYEIDDSWRQCEVLNDYQVTLQKRPVQKLKIKRGVKSSIATQGVLMRIHDSKKTVAQIMQDDFLSVRLTGEIFEGQFSSCLPSTEGIRIKDTLFERFDGVYLVIDLGREECGFLQLDLEASEGTIVDIAYGEHLDDLRVRAFVEGRNFASRYICSEGRQEFTHYFQKFGGRYIQLHILSARCGIVLFYAGMKPAEYPVEHKGRFEISDELHTKIYETSVRTLELCMHEHYEDCPWREQSFYSMDALNQALCGYYCFGDYDFAEASLRLLGDGLRDDGYLELCAPARVHVTIPGYSMLWIVALKDFLIYSGRVQMIKDVMPKVHSMLVTYVENIWDGLMVSPQGRRYWNFYEWVPGLDGQTQSGFENLTIERRDAPLNLYLCMALDSAEYLASHCGDVEKARFYRYWSDEIRNGFHRCFWNGEKKLYRTYLDGEYQEHYAELTQSLAIYAGVCPKHIAPMLRQQLARKDNGMVKMTLSTMLYKFEALFGESDKYSAMVFRSIGEIWGSMLFKGATSFWETINGADDFGRAGSLCHGWSAIPAYFYYAYVLGVKPVKPGYREFIVERSPTVSYKASGYVPTPYGLIHVEWKDTGKDIECSVKHPTGVTRIESEKSRSLSFLVSR